MQYEGDEWKGKRNGEGKAFRQDGTLAYSGEWWKDRPRGKGKRYNDDGKLEYEGELEGGSICGQGTKHAYYDDGSHAGYCVGEWEDELNGSATVHWADGTVYYKGEIRNKSKHGVGMTFRKDTTLEYAGEWKDNLRHGRGVQYHEDGRTERYVGDFAKNYPRGKGTVYDEKGRVEYQGGIKSGSSYGFGKLYLYDKEGNVSGLCTGAWRYGKCTDCIVKKEDGSVSYRGEVWNKMRDGKGKAYRTDGTMDYEGEWKENKRHGVGTLYNKGGVTPLYVGEWKDNSPNGQGRLFYENGKKRYEGMLKGGLPDGEGTWFNQEGTAAETLVYSKGKVDKAATSRKRKRDEAKELHRSSEHLEDVPECAICSEPIHHGDVAYAYVPCGHRVVCGGCHPTLDSKWSTKCLVCKRSSSWLMRVFG